ITRLSSWLLVLDHLTVRRLHRQASAVREDLLDLEEVESVLRSIVGLRMSMKCLLLASPLVAGSRSPKRYANIRLAVLGLPEKVSVELRLVLRSHMRCKVARAHRRSGRRQREVMLVIVLHGLLSCVLVGYGAILQDAHPRDCARQSVAAYLSPVKLKAMLRKILLLTMILSGALGCRGVTDARSGGIDDTPQPGLLPLGMLLHDGPATPEQISLFLPVTGSLPQTAKATVRYKLTSSSNWITGHPLYRIRPAFSTLPAVGSVPDAFAWPIIDLVPGSAY